MAYNRRKYNLENNQPEASHDYLNPSIVIRILALVIFVVAMIILAIGN